MASATHLYRLGCLSGGTGVLLGAYSSHGLRSRLQTQSHLSPSTIDSKVSAFTRASTYQLLHSILLVSMHSRMVNRGLYWPGCVLLAGVVGFSGSIYALVLLPTPVDVKKVEDRVNESVETTQNSSSLQSLRKVLGPVTPIGGLCFVAGWIGLLWL